MPEIIIGIDLGTTNSAVAAVVDGVVRVLPVQGKLSLPSAVGIDAAGKVLVGEAARNQLLVAPERTILSVKRRMGEAVKIPLGEQEYSPEEISALILRELKLAAEKELGQPVSKAVITVPAFFNEPQRKATQAAGALAGLEVVRIINEPTAAAFAYGAEGFEQENLLVYDLGGGTFDVSLVSAEAGVVEVKASFGNTTLGGDDFDELLVQLSLAEFKQAHGVDLADQRSVRARLKLALERAKIELTDNAVTTVREEFLDGTHHLNFEITRSAYEAQIASLLTKTLECVQQTLSSAGLMTSRLQKIMLVGGGSRTPAIHHLLEAVTGIAPSWSIDPDLIVAMGAAVQGAILSGAEHQAILVDITSHTYSVVTFDPQEGTTICSPVIPRGTPLPTVRSEAYVTVVDNQSQVIVSIYQGESRWEEENIQLGEFLIEDIVQGPRGQIFIFKMSLDHDGLLSVTATEKSTGMARSLKVDTKGAEVLDFVAAQEQLRALLGENDAADGEEAEEAGEVSSALLEQAKLLRQRADALIAKGIGAEDETEIGSLLKAIKEGIAQQDGVMLQTKTNALSDILFYLED